MSKTIIVKKENKGSTKPQSYKRWTEEEIEFLKKNYKFKTNHSLAKELQRSYSSVTLKAQTLGLTNPKPSVTTQVITEVVKPMSRQAKAALNRVGWSKKEIRFLKDNYGKMSFEQLAKELGRSMGSVSGKVSGLKLPLKRNKKGNTRKPWTKDDVQYLKDNYGKKSAEVIAKKLKRTSYSITSKAHEVKSKVEVTAPVAESKTPEVVKNPTSKTEKANNNAWVAGIIIALNVLTLSALTYLIFVH